MQQRLVEPFDRAVADHALMDQRVVEFCFAAAEQAQHIIGRPARMPQLAAAEARTARQLPAIGAGVGKRRLDRAGKFWRRPLVGIDRQHPLTGRQRQRIILLRPKPAPLVKLDAGALRLGDVDGAVAAAAIDHDPLVAERDAVEAIADIRRLVAGDDDGGQLRHDARSVPVRRIARTLLGRRRGAAAWPAIPARRRAAARRAGRDARCAPARSRPAWSARCAPPWRRPGSGTTVRADTSC